MVFNSKTKTNPAASKGPCICMPYSIAQLQCYFAPNTYVIWVDWSAGDRKHLQSPCIDRDLAPDLSPVALFHSVDGAARERELHRVGGGRFRDDQQDGEEARESRDETRVGIRRLGFVRGCW